MLDLEDGDVLRIGRKLKRGNAHVTVAVNAQGVTTTPLATSLTNAGVVQTLVYADTEAATAVNLRITSGKSNGQPFHNVQQFLQALRQLANNVNQIMKTTLAHVGAGDYNVGFAPHANDDDHQLEFELRPDGKLEVIGTRSFWANFFFRIEKGKYQRTFDGAIAERPQHDGTDLNPKKVMFIGARPMTGERYVVALEGTVVPRAAETAFYGQGALNAALANADIALFRAGANAAAIGRRNEKVRLLLGGNLWSTLDRRIALEMGCSLPIQNSPMIDHQQENPDFVLGRWMYNPRATQTYDTGGENGRTQLMCPSVVEYQNSTDRVCYHALMPQEKVQTLRLKMFMRIRAYDEKTDTFSMKVLQCPTSATDWWHARLHFVSKD